MLSISTIPNFGQLVGELKGNKGIFFPVLLTTLEAFVDSVDHDQTAQEVV